MTHSCTAQRAADLDRGAIRAPAMPAWRKAFPAISQYGSFFQFNKPQERILPRPDPLASDADALIDAVIDREGRYVNHPADRGGATCWGITEPVARAAGYAGGMRDLGSEGRRVGKKGG